MLHIGSYNELTVDRIFDFGVYLESEQGADVLLPGKYVPEGTAVGDRLKVFVYTDSEDRPVATTQTPKAVVGEFACLRVKDVNAFGAFLDWGLDKDLFVPFKRQHRQMEVGRSYVVRVLLDEQSGRVVAASRLNAFFNKDTRGLEEGEAVRLMIYDFTDLGIMAVVDNEYSGVLYRSEVFEPLRFGDVRDGYIKKIRPDGRLDLMLRKPGYAAVTDLKPQVLEALERAGGFLPYHGKSDADEIRAVFKMSKKVFKQVIGGLYKEGAITVGEDGMRLVGKGK